MKFSVSGNPLCLTHRTPMTADAPAEPESRSATESVSYSCGPDCDLNWERRLGYFRTASKTTTFQFGIEGRRCPLPGHYFLYLAQVSDDGNQRTFRCAVKDCARVEHD